jgi:hypothetical protein
MGMNTKRERPDEARKRRRFGPSKAVVQVAPGQKEAQVLSIMRSLLGRPKSSSGSSRRASRRPAV